MTQRDPFNDVERAIVESLKHGRVNEDEDRPERLLIDNNGNPINGLDICLFHEKPRRDPEGWPTYYAVETPAVGIYASGKNRDNEIAVGQSIIPVDVVMDVVVMGGDEAQIDTDMKQIMGCIDQYFRELEAGEIEDAPYGITTIATLLTVGRGIMNPPYSGSDTWISEGATSLHVQVRTSLRG